MRRTVAGFLARASFVCGSLVLTTAPALASNRPVPATPTAIAVYAKVLRHINPQMPGWQSRDLARRVLVNAVRWRIDANMLIAIVTVESRWHTHAVSSAGAIGLGQLMPGTAALLGVNPRDPKQNLSGAARYLRGLIQRFGHKNYDLVFAAYNAGPHAVSEYGGIPPYEETRGLRRPRALHLGAACPQRPSAGQRLCRHLTGTRARHRLLARGRHAVA